MKYAILTLFYLSLLSFSSSCATSSQTFSQFLNTSVDCTANTCSDPRNCISGVQNIAACLSSANYAACIDAVAPVLSLAKEDIACIVAALKDSSTQTTAVVSNAKDLLSYHKLAIKQ
jgi:hypothetical protein